MISIDNNKFNVPQNFSILKPDEEFNALKSTLNIQTKYFLFKTFFVRHEYKFLPAIVGFTFAILLPAFNHFHRNFFAVTVSKKK